MRYNLKNITFLLLLLLCNSIFVRAIDVMEYYNGWYVMQGDDNGVSSSKYACVWGDSIINDVSYRKLYVSDSSISADEIIFGEFCDTVLLYRNEGDKLFRYIDGKDRLVYDFGISTGQEFMDAEGITWRVVDMFNANRMDCFTNIPDDIKAFRIQNIHSPYQEDVVIENVGSVRTGILLNSDFDEHSDPSLSYFNSMHERQTLAFRQSFGSTTILPFKRSDTYDPYNREHKLHYEFKEDKLHIYGQIYVYENNFHLLNVSVESNKIDILIQPIFCMSESIDRLSESCVDIELPGFTAGTYKTHTDDYISQLNNTPDTVLTCNGPVSGIKDIYEDKAERAFSDNIYDLSGRRLAGPPEHGVYIQGGRVRAK